MAKYHAGTHNAPVCGARGNGNRSNVVIVDAAQWNILSVEQRCSKCSAKLAAKKQNRSERQSPRINKDTTLALLDRTAALSGHIGCLSQFETPAGHRYAFDSAIREAQAIVGALQLAKEAK